MRRARLLLITCAAALVAGCAVVVDPPPPTSVPGSVSSRPRELPLDGIDPCTLLTPEQRRGIGLDLSSSPFQAYPPVAGRACSMGGFQTRDIGVGLALATGTSFSSITELGTNTGGFTPTTIAGYPAAITKSRQPDSCFVDVDIAEGQVFSVLFRDSGLPPPIPQEQLCRDGVQVADKVIRTLATR